jgi:hypothetical protein
LSLSFKVSKNIRKNLDDDKKGDLMKQSFNRISVPFLWLLLIGSGIIGKSSGRQDRQRLSSSPQEALLSARKRIKDWMEETFINCGPNQRYVLWNAGQDTRLVNFARLDWEIRADKLSYVDEVDNKIEFRGIIKLGSKSGERPVAFRVYSKKEDAWKSDYSERVFPSSNGSLDDTIRFEKRKSSDWKFDSAYTRPEIPCSAIRTNQALSKYILSPSEKREMAALAEEEARLLREIAREKELLKNALDTLGKEKGIKSADESVFMKEVQAKVDRFLAEHVMQCGDTRYVVYVPQLSNQVCACEIRGTDSSDGTIADVSVAGGSAVLTLSGTRIVEHCYTGREYTEYKGNATGPFRIYFKKQSPEWEIRSSSGAGVGVIQPKQSSSSCQKLIDGIDSWRSFGQRRR